MNLSRYDLTHFKICLHSIIVMAVAAICFSSQAQADGVILIKSHATQSPQFWRAFAFSKNEASSYNYNVTLLNGQQHNFFRTEVGAIFEEPKWNELIITSDADWQKLEQQKSKLLDSLGQFPQLKNWSDSLAAKFDNLLDKNSSSVVVYKGQIISRDDYNKLRGQDSPSNSEKLEKGVLAELTIGSVKLTNIKLKSFDESRVSLIHSNGIQGYSLSDLKEAEISSLSKAFPEFAEHVKKLLADASAKAASSKEPSSTSGKKQSASEAKSMTLSDASDAAKLKKAAIDEKARLEKEALDKKAKLEKEAEISKTTDENRIFFQLLKSHEAESANIKQRVAVFSELARKEGLLVIKGLYIGMPFQHIWPTLNEKHDRKLVLQEIPSTEGDTMKLKGYAITVLSGNSLSNDGELFVDSKTQTLKSFNLGVSMLVDLFKLNESQLDWEDFVQVFINEYGIPKMQGTRSTNGYTTTYHWSYLAKDFKVGISNYTGLTVNGISSSAFGD